MTVNIDRSRRPAGWASEILAALVAVFLAGASLPAAGVTMKDSVHSVEIAGGAGASAWRLLYGTQLTFRVPHELAVARDTAYFSHGHWLRQIDARRGVVTGRWHFPWQISKLVPQNGKVRVEIAQSEDLSHGFQESVLLDPAAPQIPNWPDVSPPLAHTEATAAWRLSLASFTAKGAVSPERARELLPEVEEMVRRDPQSPWFRVTLGMLLKAVGDPRAITVFHEAAGSSGADYTELLRVSALFSQLGEAAAAREAFERGYRDFLNRGFDPRLLRSIWLRRDLYPASHSDAEWMERAYRLAPYTRESSLAWEAFAGQLEKDNHADQAKLWRERAADPQSFDISGRSETTMGLCGVALLGADIGIWGYVFVLYFRYRTQRLQDRAAGTGWLAKPYVSLLRLEYTDRWERAALLGLMLTASTAMGLFVTIGEGWWRTIRSAESFWSGSLAGPANLWYLEKQLSPSPERSLLLATAYQQSGADEQAERLYRDLPGFAEGWNNLGVLLKKKGKEAESRAAFEQALRLDPSLAEADLNLHGKAGDFWTTQYAKAFPGRPMLAVPRGERFERAFYERPFWQSYLRALAGPFILRPLPGIREIPLAGMRQGFFVMFSLGIALLLVVPRLRVSIRHNVLSRVGEILLPGSCRSWLWLGGVLNGVLMAGWIWLIFYTWWLTQAPNSALGPFAISRAWYSPNLGVSYGLKVNIAPGGSVLPWTVLVLLFAVNLALVVRSWRGEKSVAG